MCHAELASPLPSSMPSRALIVLGGESWLSLAGTSWGEQGYFRVRRGFAEMGLEKYATGAHPLLESQAASVK